MNRLDGMRVLLAVIDEGNLSRAGRRLRMPLSTVSRRISELETELGARLLTRDNRTLGVTDAGRDYAEACRRILDDMEQAERTARGEYQMPQGELVITTPVVFGRLHLLPIIVEFLQHYPAITIRLVQADRVVSLLDDHVDVALRIGKLPDNRLVAVPLGEVDRLVCASPAYLQEHGTPKQLAELSSHACIAFDNPAGHDNWLFEGAAGKHRVSLTPRLRVNTVEAALDAARAGLGLVRLFSYQVIPALQQGELVRVLDQLEPETQPIHLVYAHQGAVPLKLRAFIDFARPRLRERSHLMRL